MNKEKCIFLVIHIFLDYNITTDNCNINNSNLNCNGWFVNLTDTTIPDRVINTVSMGQKYSVNTGLNNRSAIDTIKSIENLLHHVDLPSNVINDIRYGTITSINRHIHNIQHLSQAQKDFQKDPLFTKSFLQSNNNSLFFTNSYKGNSTVANIKLDYIKEIKLYSVIKQHI